MRARVRGGSGWVRRQWAVLLPVGGVLVSGGGGIRNEQQWLLVLEETGSQWRASTPTDLLTQVRGGLQLVRGGGGCR